MPVGEMISGERYRLAGSRHPRANREHAEQDERQQRHATEPAHRYVSLREMLDPMHEARDASRVHIQAAQSII
jgi:hypothetical protein